MQKLKKEGFDYQRLIVLPSSIKVQLSADPFIRQLYLTDIGIFPNAENHLVNRRQELQNTSYNFALTEKDFVNSTAKKGILQPEIILYYPLRNSTLMDLMEKVGGK